LAGFAPGLRWRAGWWLLVVCVCSLRVRVALAWCGGLWLVVWRRVFLRLRLCVCASCAWLPNVRNPVDGRRSC
jgi:hypothetical protein